MTRMEYGTTEGEICNREGCKGVIGERRVKNCSCHILPPCSCTDPRNYCPDCDWEASEDAIINNPCSNVHKPQRDYPGLTYPALDPARINWINKPHSSCSMLKEGCYPVGTPRSEVEALVRGTFGGRFESFGGGKFKYIAYTD